MLGKIEGRRRRGRQTMKWFDGIINSMDMSLRKLLEIVKDRETWYAAVHRVAKRQQLSNNSNNNSTPCVVICCYSSDRKLIQPQPLSQVPRLAWPSSTLETVAPLPYCPERLPLRPSTTLFLLPDTTLLDQRLTSSSHTALTPGSYLCYSLLDPQGSLP